MRWTNENLLLCDLMAEGGNEQHCSVSDKKLEGIKKDIFKREVFTASFLGNDCRIELKGNTHIHSPNYTVQNKK